MARACNIEHDEGIYYRTNRGDHSRDYQRFLKTLGNLKISVALLSVGIMSFCGCYQSTSDQQWEKTVPGTYDGSQPGFREVVTLNASGDFRHEVFIEERLAVDESGKWSYDVASGMIEMIPYTSYFDPDQDKLTTIGVRTVAFSLGVLRYGKAAERITPSINGGYYLSKKHASAVTNDPTNKTAVASEKTFTNKIANDSEK